ncbi:unnamed protein product [Rotaria socialis]|uniref:Uncharacterized protein n=2 Tax=Rotaria socialis TaxID=392032 RepID=A0A820ZCB3_9BILA|nr:unnamed protein product [Rotaria socialis]
MTRSNDSYFSSIIVDGVSYSKPPYPTSFVMKKPTMKIQFGSFRPATITSVSVLNPNESQITSMIVETDYDVYNSTNLDGLQVNFQPNVDFNTHIIITLKTTMANAIFPKTIQLAIYGCGQPSSPVTKAQIESTITATLSPAMTSSGVVPKTSAIVSQSTSGITETVILSTGYCFSGYRIYERNFPWNESQRIEISPIANIVEENKMSWRKCKSVVECAG